MFTSTESRLWLAVHLLYPNASQAFDVYQAVIQQSENLIEQNNRGAVFTKLIHAFEKIPAISSNLSFYEFEFDQIDQWKVIYKNSQKIQLVIFVGVLIFELKMSDIAPLLKLSADKAQFLFHQIFKKLAQNSSKLKYNEQLNFKKQNDLKISYLYTYENLIEYCLGQLPPEDHEKVKTGLELYPILQMTKDEYLKIISQIQNLKVQKSSSMTTKDKNQSKPSGKSQTGETSESAPSFFGRKRNIAALTLISLATASVVFHTTGVLDYILNRDQILVIQSLDKKDEVAPVRPDIAADSVPKEAPEVVSGDQTEVSLLSTDTTTVAEVPPVIEPEKPEPVKPEPPAVVAHKPDLPSEPGGLFRGALLVKDVKAVNAQLAAKMSELGATKAGEVALGWMKSDKMAYYHYVIPENKIAEANEFFKQYGKLVLKFEKHPRAIPAGSRRFIIEVEQKE